MFAFKAYWSSRNKTTARTNLVGNGLSSPFPAAASPSANGGVPNPLQAPRSNDNVAAYRQNGGSDDDDDDDSAVFSYKSHHSRDKYGKKRPNQQRRNVRPRSSNLMTILPLVIVAGLVASMTQSFLFAMKLEQSTASWTSGASSLLFWHEKSRATSSLLQQPPWRLMPSNNKKQEHYVQPQQFVLDSPEALYQSYGIRMVITKAANDTATLSGDFSSVSSIVNKGLISTLQSTLCGANPTTVENSTIAALNDSNDCLEDFQVLKCVSCGSISASGGGTGDAWWYAAQSQSAGSLFALVKEQTGSVINMSPVALSQSFWQHIDIMVPVAGNPKNLLRLAKQLGQAVQVFRSTPYGKNVQVRLIATRYSEDASALGQDYFWKSLETVALGIQVVAAPCVSDKFHRAQATNCLLERACRTESCVVTLVDVDMRLHPQYLLHAMTYVWPHSAAFFPIVFSQFNPKTVQLVDQLAEKDDAIRWILRSHKEQYRGEWRTTGFGMWAMAGSDAATFQMNEGFRGWGGEDVDFYGLVASRLHIVRAKEPGLEHIWHLKECKLGSTVMQTDLYKDCVNSGLKAEGRSLGVYLRRQGQQRREEELVTSIAASDPVVAARANQKQDFNDLPEDFGFV